MAKLSRLLQAVFTNILLVIMNRVIPWYWGRERGERKWNTCTCTQVISNTHIRVFSNMKRWYSSIRQQNKIPIISNHRTPKKWPHDNHMTGHMISLSIADSAKSASQRCTNVYLQWTHADVSRYHTKERIILATRRKARHYHKPHPPLTMTSGELRWRYKGPHPLPGTRGPCKLVWGIVYHH